MELILIFEDTVVLFNHLGHTVCFVNKISNCIVIIAVTLVRWIKKLLVSFVSLSKIQKWKCSGSQVKCMVCTQVQYRYLILVLK